MVFFKSSVFLCFSFIAGEESLLQLNISDLLWMGSVSDDTESVWGHTESEKVGTRAQKEWNSMLCQS